MTLGTSSPRARQRLLAVSFVLFVVVGAVSIAALPAGLEFHWWPLPLLIVVTTPLTYCANAAEYRLMAGMSGFRVTWFDSLRLSVIAAAANLLPVPGGVLVRAQALRTEGASYRRAFGANAAAGLMWIACACAAIAALFVLESRTRIAAGGLAAVGIVAVLGMWWFVHRLDRDRKWGFAALLAMVEAATVLVSAIRLLLAFHLIGLSASAAQATALTAAQIIAAAIGFFPAGLGLRELLAGAIGAAVNVGAAQAVLAAAADRIAGMVGTAMLTGALLSVRGRGR